MKKKFALLILCLVAAFAASSFAACNKGETYTLTFYTNGGTDIAAYSLKEGEKIPAPAAPEKDYFTFEGWYEDENLEQKFRLFGEPMPAENLSAYASWIPDESVKVTYDSQGGSEVKASVGVIGSALIAPDEPVRAGYAFGGWYKESECITAWKTGFCISRRRLRSESFKNRCCTWKTSWKAVCIVSLSAGNCWTDLWSTRCCMI